MVASQHFLNAQPPLLSQEGITFTRIKLRHSFPMLNVLSVDNLSKKYGDTVAVDGISFEIRRNEIVGLLGPNGAGKTTTINMILGVLEPTSGSIRIEDIDVAKQRSKALSVTNF